MITPSYKSKQYLLVALKVLILTVTFVYIYFKLTGDSSLKLSLFFSALWHKDPANLLVVFLFFILAASNWFFEIFKWKTVASAVTSISLKTAMRQSLAALTVSLATPNRIGDYGAKAYFFKKKFRKRILLLNLFANGMQLITTLFFGMIGCAYLLWNFSIGVSLLNIMLLIFVLLLLVVFGYLFKEKEFLSKGFSIANVVLYLRELPLTVKLKTIIFSVIRYAIFSSLFYLLLNFFGADISYSSSIFLIFAMYLMVSVIPTLFILDVVVRGGVAVWLFSLAGINELPVLSTVLAMWLLNFVIPAVWGSFYVATYKFKSE